MLGRRSINMPRSNFFPSLLRTIVNYSLLSALVTVVPSPLSNSLCLSFSLPICLSFSLSLSHTVFLFLYLTLLFLPISLSLTFFVCLYLTLSLSLSLALSQCRSLSLSHIVFLFLYLTLSFFVKHTIFLTYSNQLPLSLSFSHVVLCQFDRHRKPCFNFYFIPLTHKKSADAPVVRHCIGFSRSS